MVMEASVVAMVCVGFITMMALCQNLGMFFTNSYRRNSLRLAFFVEQKNRSTKKAINELGLVGVERRRLKLRG
jgi:hypothetical protein